MRNFSPFLMAATLLLFASPAFAEFKPSPWVDKTPYAEKISQKLGFGALNFFTGWTALFFEPARPGNKLAGLGKGILYTITNTAGGAIHAVTFPIPIDLPLPEGGISHEYES